MQWAACAAPSAPRPRPGVIGFEWHKSLALPLIQFQVQYQHPIQLCAKQHCANKEQTTHGCTQHTRTGTKVWSVKAWASVRILFAQLLSCVTKHPGSATHRSRKLSHWHFSGGPLSTPKTFWWGDCGVHIASGRVGKGAAELVKCLTCSLAYDDD